MFRWHDRWCVRKYSVALSVFFVLHEAIQHIRKPLDYSARHDFVHIERVRDLEKTITTWVEHAGAALPSSQYQRILDQFQQIFQGYDVKNRSQKILVIQEALHLLDQLESLDAARSVPQDTPHALKRSTPPPLSPSANPPQAASPESEIGAEQWHDLSQQIQFAKGVGPKRVRLLNKLGIYTIEDALFFFPRRYEDRRRIEKIASLRPGEALRTVYGEVKTSGVTVTPKQRTKIFELMISDDTGVFTAKWFNQGYLRKIFKSGMHVVLCGKIGMKRYGGLEMIQPEYEIVDSSEAVGERLHTGRIVPIYSLTDGLYQKEMRKIMKQIVDRYAPSVEENLPDGIRQRHQFLPLSTALKRLHFPEQTDDIDRLNSETSPAHHRLIFDEFFLLELGMSLKRHHVQCHETGIAFQFSGIIEKYLRTTLDFSLTSAQDRVISEIQHNMRSPRVMNRLLQGDVGSGKTLVALIALLSAIEAGYQGAIMVPTEILAEQHFRKISTYLQQLNRQMGPGDFQGAEYRREAKQPDLYSSTPSTKISTCLLTGSLKKREREELLLRIGRGEVDLIVGTHALLQHDVSFHKLGFVVIDEQHKFGVLQRATLKAKGVNPDILIMTATPIPRTLSLTIYGDLDVSILDELPPGRTPVVTQRFYEQSREKAYRLIQREIDRGRQAYIVYPLVEESENLDLKAATEMSEHLARDIFPQYNVGLVHGRMKGEEKDRHMSAFKNHELDILVSTTVLEVGIDVSNATVMLIEHAERFGLSQLHQLRGRVGRGAKQSYCLLMAQFPMSNDARKRLDAMIETTDGFMIAERDLEIRGPGEFFGTRQSGLPDLHVANVIRDIQILESAREEAFAITNEDPGLTFPQHRPVKNALEHRWKKSLDLISVG